MLQLSLGSLSLCNPGHNYKHMLDIIYNPMTRDDIFNFCLVTAALHKAQIYFANQNLVSEISMVKTTFFFNLSKAFSLSKVLKIPSSASFPFQTV